jgi:hypothetical protein
MTEKAMTPIEWLTQYYTEWERVGKNHLPPKAEILRAIRGYATEHKLEGGDWFVDTKKQAPPFNQHFLNNRGKEKKDRVPYPPGGQLVASEGGKHFLMRKIVELLTKELTEMGFVKGMENLEKITSEIMEQIGDPPSVGGWDPPNTDKGNVNRDLLIQQTKGVVMEAVLNKPEMLETGGGQAGAGGGRSTRRRRRKNKARTKKKFSKSRKRKSSKRRRRKRKYRTSR